MNVTLSFAAALASMVSFGLLNGFSRDPSRKIGPIKATIYRELVTIPLLAVITFFALSSWDIDLKYVLIGFAIAAASYSGLYFFMKGLEVGDASIVSTVVSARVLITTIVAVTFLNDKLKGEQIFFMMLIILGIGLLSFSGKSAASGANGKMNLNMRTIGYSLLAALGWGVTFALFSIPVAKIGAYLFSLVVEVAVLVVSVAHAKLNGEKLSAPRSQVKPLLWHLVAMGVCATLGTLFMNIAYSYGSVSVVSAITSAQPIATITFATLFLHEKITWKQFGAIILIILGVVLVSYF